MKRKTYYDIILDQSGSMADCIDSTVEGFNSQIRMIRGLETEIPEEEVLFGLTVFNDIISHKLFAAQIGSVGYLEKRDFQPNSSTALLDAIGITTNLIRRSISQDLEEGASVVIVIITDGMENASTRFSYTQIRQMISELEETRKWTFSFLGASNEVVSVAKALKIQEENTMVFDKRRMDKTFDILNNSMCLYLSSKQKGQDLRNFLKKRK
jgi:hypothetical protein